LETKQIDSRYSVTVAFLSFGNFSIADFEKSVNTFFQFFLSHLNEAFIAACLPWMANSHFFKEEKLFNTFNHFFHLLHFYYSTFQKIVKYFF